jgi:hypothetical protein
VLSTQGGGEDLKNSSTDYTDYTDEEVKLAQA